MVLKTLLLIEILWLATTTGFSQPPANAEFPSHRVFVNPTQIITGVYTVTYSWKNRSNDFLEIGGGYQYFPFSLSNPQEPVFGDEYASPHLGLGYHGPQVSFSFTNYSKTKPGKNTRVEVTYKYLDHPYQCYAVSGSTEYEQTFSGSKHVLIAKVLWSKTLVAKNGKTLIEPYAGVGLRCWYGHEVSYLPLHPNDFYYLCMDEKPSPANSTQQITSFFTTVPLPAIHLGFRLGNQW
jgi:hypothetical protein